MKSIQTYFRTAIVDDNSPVQANAVETSNAIANNTGTATTKRARASDVFNPDDIVADLALRKQIEEYATLEIRDEVRRVYLLKGPCQPRGHVFPRKNNARAFREAWYDQFDWLEYSVAKDATYCLYYFLFKKLAIAEKFGGDAFSKTGFTNWKRVVEYFNTHVGRPNSFHNNARKYCDDFKNQKQSVSYAFSSHSNKSEIAYESRLTAVVGVVRFLLMQALAFRGHNESSTSINKGNFRELLNWYGERVKDVGDVINDNAPLNHQLTSPKIQKEIVKACAQETTQVILAELGDGHFSLLVDESRDASVKEQMAVIVRLILCFSFSFFKLFGPLSSYKSKFIFLL